jgi:hypothetical protein
MSEFEVILPLKVEGVVELLMNEQKMSLEDALTYLYTSKLYTLLECEDLKKQ